MKHTRIIKQMKFIEEVEKLKVVYRQNGIIDGTRLENSAEHSWHVAILAITLEEYAESNTDISKVIKMLLIHDLVEIYTGDTFLYDEQGRKDVKVHEQKAADKIFGLLPKKQGEYLNKLWKEFEENKTKEARFALVLDNLQPILNHYYTRNQNIKGKKVKKSQILKKKSFIKDYSPELWEFALDIINKSVEIGQYEDDL